MKFLCASGLESLGTMMMIVVLIAIFVGIIETVAVVLNEAVRMKTRRARRTKTENGLCGEEIARNLLDNLNMKDVQVKKGGFFKIIFFGNHYNHRKKTIYLSKKVLNGATIDSVSNAVLSVAEAESMNLGDEKLSKSAWVRNITMFAPFMFVPLFLVGLFLDLVTGQGLGVATFGFTLFGFLFYLLAIVFFAISIPQKKKAMNRALEIIQVTNLLTEEERKIVESNYKCFILVDVVNMIFAILYFVKILIKVFASLSKKKK